MSAPTLSPVAALASPESHQRDPLKYFRFKNWAARKLAEFIHTFFVYWHSGNLGGKTTHAAALVVAMLRGWTELDGIKLPNFGKKAVSWILLVPSYKQSEMSTLQILKDMIGPTPKHVVPVPGTQWPSVIYVKPDLCRSDDIAHWSVLYVVPHGGEVPAGARMDGIWCDEPPPISMLRELLFRFRKTGFFVRMITATGLNRLDSKRGAGWGPILQMFEDCLMDPKRGRVRIQSSIYDNESLHRDRCTVRGPGCGCPAITMAEEAAGVDWSAHDPWEKADPEAKARLLGEHVDASGSNPFKVYDVLDRWMDATRPPDHVIEFVVQAERDTPDGKKMVPITVRYEAWGEVDESDVYIVVVDPARGMSGGKHDPDGIHVWSRRRKALVGRVNQYLGGWGAGLAAAELGRTYITRSGDGGTVIECARVDVLRTGGYGETVLSALRQVGYTKFTAPTVEDSAKPQVATKLGFIETHTSRGRMIGALEQALVTGDASIPSRDVVQCLKDCVIDENGKIVAGTGRHDEDLILAGRALQLIQSKVRPAPVQRVSEVPSVQAFAEAVNRSFGRKVIVNGNGNGNGNGLLHDGGRW